MRRGVGAVHQRDGAVMDGGGWGFVWVAAMTPAASAFAVAAATALRGAWSEAALYGLLAAWLAGLGAFFARWLKRG